MVSRSEPGVPEAAPALPPEARPRPASLSASPPWLMAAGFAAILFLLHPLTWTRSAPPLWSPPAGLALVLVAWFGRRFGAIALAGAGLLLLARQLVRLAGGDDPGCLAWGAAEAALGVITPITAWWLYHDQARGSQRLADPRSAILFVLLAPVASAAAAALPRAALAQAVPPPGAVDSFLLLLVEFWLSDALGMLVLAPPLLVLVTPWLAQRGLIPPEPWPGRGAAPSAGIGISWHWGDWLEVAGLTFGAGLLCLMLTGLHGRKELLGWQLWGVQLLLIVWAALRQGLAGGTLVAAVAAALPLMLWPLWSAGEPDPLFLPLLQAHLLAQCAAAVLIAAAASWVRINETGYRQVVAHIPVVIYSARLTRLAAAGTPAAQKEAGTHNDVGLAETSRLAEQGMLPSPHAAPPHFAEAEITLVSAASARLLGCRADELLGDYQRWLALVHPEDREVVLAALEQLARQDQPVTCEYRLAGTDPGSSKRGLPAEAAGPPRKARWLRDTLAPHRDREGRLIGWEGVVTDITEQRALADDLRRTTTMFNALVSNLPAGVFFVKGPHGQPILVNPRARQLLGQREEPSAALEYLPRVYRLFKADGTPYPAEELPVYLALKQGRTTMRDDIIVHRPDGRRIPLVTWAAPIQLGRRAGHDAAVWVLEDLTALHQAEAARKDSEGRLRAVIETMAEGLVVLDGRGNVVTSNPASCALFNQSSERLRGRSLAELGWSYRREDGTPLPAEEHPAAVALRTGRPVRNVLLGVQPRAEGGEEKLSPGLAARWLLVNAMPLATAAGQVPAGVVATFYDLSAYVQAREGIRVSEERYRTLVETLPLMLIQSDRDLRITYINPATEQITGYTLDELSDPASWLSLIHPEDLPRAFEVARQALEGTGGRGEVRYRARDGAEKVCFFLAQPRHQDGVVAGVTTLLVDVTRERQLERELQRSQRLELVGRLASGVAHDFNNLLGVVLSLTDLARAHLPADHPVHVDLRRISEAGEQAAGLAGQLLALARQRPGTLRRIEVNQIVRRTLDLLRATLPGAIGVESELCEEELFIRGDETQVQQVLMNLCLNARDAMPGGGRLAVRTALDRGGARPEVRLAVEDSGLGMPEDVRLRIFEPFYSTKEGGTGLGLAVVQQIVESYGGRIEVSSEPGAGSRFEVCWPTSEAVGGGRP